MSGGREPRPVHDPAASVDEAARRRLVRLLLMDRLGHVERCVVEQAEEHRTQKRPVVEYVLGCPGGDVELTEDWSDRFRTSEADILVGPPLRPVLAAPDLRNLPLVTGVLVAMTAAIPVAHVLRRRP